MTTGVTRRHALCTGVSALAALAGCMSGQSQDTPRSTETSSSTSTRTTQSSQTTSSVADSSTTDNWSSIHHDSQNTRFNPATSLPQTKPSLSWKSDISFTTSPIIVDNSVIIGGRSKLYSFNAETGEQQWQIEAPSEVINQVAVHQQTIFTSAGGSQHGFIRALDMETQEEKWRRTFGATMTGPTVAGNRVYFLGLNGFYSLDAQTGKTKAKAPTTGDPPRTSFNPAVSGEKIFTAQEGAGVVIQGGKRVKQVKPVKNISRWRFGSPPVVGSNHALFSGVGGVKAIDIQSLKTAWTFAPIDSYTDFTGLATDTAKTYVIASSQSPPTLYALQNANGNKIWDLQLKGLADPFLFTSIAKDSILIGDDTNLVAITKTGKKKWHLNAPDDLGTAEYSSFEYGPVISKDRVYAILDNKLYVLG